MSVELTGGLVLTRPIHVALDEFYGTPLTGTTVATRNTEVNTLGSAVGTFDPTPASGTFSQAWFVANFGLTLDVETNRLQYAPIGVGGNAVTVFDPAPLNARRVFGVFVGPNPYDTPPIQVQEDVSGTISHENVHVAQLMAIRDNVPTGNVWRWLDNYYSVDRTNGINGYRSFIEAKAHLNEVSNTSLGWYHLRGLEQNDVPTFQYHFDISVTRQFAMDAITSNDVSTKNATKVLLQNLYTGIPTELVPQMKTYGWVNGYDYFVRPPL